MFDQFTQPQSEVEYQFEDMPDMLPVVADTTYFINELGGLESRTYSIDVGDSTYTSHSRGWWDEPTGSWS